MFFNVTTTHYLTTTTLHYTTLNQRYEYEQCYHSTAQEIKKSLYLLPCLCNIVQFYQYLIQVNYIYVKI
jgi:hypothetical protein